MILITILFSLALPPLSPADAIRCEFSRAGTVIRLDEKGAQLIMDGEKSCELKLKYAEDLSETPAVPQFRFHFTRECKLARSEGAVEKEITLALFPQLKDPYGFGYLFIDEGQSDCVPNALSLEKLRKLAGKSPTALPAQ